MAEHPTLLYQMQVCAQFWPSSVMGYAPYPQFLSLRSVCPGLSLSSQVVNFAVNGGSTRISKPQGVQVQFRVVGCQEWEYTEVRRQSQVLIPMVEFFFRGRLITFFDEIARAMGFLEPQSHFLSVPPRDWTIENNIAMDSREQIRISIVDFAVIVQSQNWGGGGGRGAMKLPEVWRQLAQGKYPE